MRRLEVLSRHLSSSSQQEQHAAGVVPNATAAKTQKNPDDVVIVL